MKANGGFPNLSREERDRLERHTGQNSTRVPEVDVELFQAMNRAEMVFARMRRERELRSKKKKKQP